MCEALRIGFRVLATAAIVVSVISQARAEDEAASFQDRWAIAEAPPFRCGFRPSDDAGQEPVEDYETIERKERARFKAILALPCLALPSREG